MSGILFFIFASCELLNWPIHSPLASKPPTNMTWKERYPDLLACVYITYQSRQQTWLERKDTLICLLVYTLPIKATNKHDLKGKIPRSACLCIHYLSKPPTNMTWKERYNDLFACVYITYLSRQQTWLEKKDTLICSLVYTLPI